MHTPVISVGEDEDLLHAARQLAAHGWSGAPVVDEKGFLVGVLSEKDVVVALAEAAFHEHPMPKTVGEVMNQPPVWVTPATEIFAVISLLAGTHRKRVPVVENGVLVGIITRRDLMRALVSFTAAKGAPLRRDTTDEVALRQGSHNPFAHHSFSRI